MPQTNVPFVTGSLGGLESRPYLLNSKTPRSESKILPAEMDVTERVPPDKWGRPHDFDRINRIYKVRICRQSCESCKSCLKTCP